MELIFLQFSPYAIAGLLLVFLALLVGTYTDLRWHEMPDWVNYALIASGFFLNLLASILEKSLSPMINSISGFFLFYLLSSILFYTGQWGGGDAKALMGIGAVLGIDVMQTLQGKVSFSLIFFLNTLLLGAAYGFFWGVGLAFLKRKQFFPVAKKEWRKRTVLRITLIGLGCIFFVSSLFFFQFFYWVLFLALSIFSIGFLLLFIFIKSVEKGILLKRVDPEALTEGDWIAENIVVQKPVVPIQVLKERFDPYLQRSADADVLAKLLLFFHQVFGLPILARLHKKRLEKYDFDVFLSVFLSQLTKKIISEHPAYATYPVQETLIKLLSCTLQEQNALCKAKPWAKNLVDVLEQEGIYWDKMVVAGPTDLGIEREQIALLKRLKQEGAIKKVLIKEGIPFIPSFLLGFLFTIGYGNLLTLLF